MDINLLQVVDNIYSFFHTEYKIKFTPGFNQTNRNYRGKYSKRHNLTTLLWDRFLCIFLVKWSSKESKLSLWINFWSTSWKFFSLLFLVYFEYFQHRRRHNIYMWLCKQCNIYDIHLHIKMYSLLSYSSCSVSLCWKNISMLNPF